MARALSGLLIMFVGVGGMFVFANLVVLADEKNLNKWVVLGLVAMVILWPSLVILAVEHWIQ